eukprot:TRINITY_DN3880_c0_g1_i16.p1 TRINITY_DN3880_c0_g1~~TRINITY_DN3880_c0_g1_i16.p1  ORF type:complete len:952 (+),score=286.58 TRINITY_DN3880_c0_g1_i16:120-2858(+)
MCIRDRYMGTLMQLIERFYDADTGAIEFDGQNVKDLDLRSLRSLIGYVGQEPVLFGTSIRENLLIANEKATEEQIIEALKAARAYDFVMDREGKLESYVGVGGTQLSGGQKQRLAIARAILKNPKILLLDEATSALDRTNEVLIQKTLDEVAVGRTTVVIAHRLTTIKDADKIVYIDNGVVAEYGTHEELMKKEGKYYALYQHQMSSDEGNIAVAREEEIENNDDIAPKADKDIKEDAKSRGRAVSGENIKGGASVNPLEVVVNTNKEEKNEEEEVDPKLKKEREKQKQAKLKAYQSRLFAMNKPEMPIMMIGCVVAGVNGCIFPFFAIVLSKMLTTLSLSGSEFRSEANFLSIMFLILAGAAFVVNFLQNFLFSYVGENLTFRLRNKVYERIITFNIGFFDDPKHSPGALASTLSADAQLVNVLTSSIIAIQIQSLASFVCGMVIAFIASWKLTLVSLSTTPFMILSGQMQAKLAAGFSAKTDSAYKESGSIIMEAVTGARTVASFGNERKLLALYDKGLDKPRQQATRRGIVAGIMFGFSQFTMFGTYAYIFYIGALFTVDQGLGLEDMFTSIFGIIFAAFGSGQATQFMGDVGGAQNALERLFGIYDQPSLIDIHDARPNKNPIKGEIEFRNVSFKYPSRNQQVLKNISFKISAGDKVAFVGPSGCGKSTIIQLLQRFYDPDEGEILIDGVSIKDYDLIHLRNQIGIVSQEPVLFNGTIEYNIKYTLEDASMEAVKEAAAQANALGFIEKNEFETGGKKDAQSTGTGFHKQVGPKGSQISGGQKQRIAIARCVLRKPAFFMFDEATSALDNQNEKIVQDSLNSITTGKTSITVAHRITTIKDSTEILVLKDGNIAERGHYNVLTANPNGIFYKLERGILDDPSKASKHQHLNKGEFISKHIRQSTVTSY